jgi:hypothetical protein
VHSQALRCQPHRAGTTLTSLAERLAHENVLQALLALLLRLGQQHALAGGQAAGLEHDALGAAAAAHKVARVDELRRVEGGKGGRGDVVPRHEGLGKRLAALHLGGDG